MDPKTATEFSLPLEWITPEQVQTHYANNMLIQHTNSEFYISFFETKPPVILGSPEEISLALKSLRTVKTFCVARIVLGPEKMKEFVEAVELNYKNFLESQKDIE